MFTVYHSNRLEILAEQLADLVATPLSPLKPEVIVVQSNGMARWLSLHLAKRLGVCANVRFPFPAAFIWETFRAVLRDIPPTSPFESSVLTWRLMDMLRDVTDEPLFAPLKAYLRDDDDFRRFDLASRIAGVFDQYLIYRPDWIVAWEDGKGAHWQAELWRRLAAGDGIHRVRLQQRFLQALNPAAAAKADLPERVSLIGISSLAPMVLEAFAHLSGFIDIHLFLLNPCQEYWGDIVAERDIARRGADVDAEALYLEVGNNLLASLGKQGRDFVDLIQNQASAVVERFVEPEGDSLLSRLQGDILHLRNRGDDDCPPLPIALADRSVQIHACHSPMREVEVLYDQLLDLFQTWPDLQPADVVVMTPDIDLYGPLIEAVFATAKDARYIPFSVADRGARADSPLVDAFFNVLDLHGGRFDANRVLALLEVRAVQRRFEIDEDDLPLIHRWVRDTGIRWGIDEDHRAALDLPATRENAWRVGLDRLLLGYALPGGNRLFNDLLPYDAVEGTQARVMGQLQAFTEALFRLNETLVGQKSAVAWTEILNGLLADFLAPAEAEASEIQLIRDALAKLAQSVQQAGFHEVVSLPVIKSWLRRYLDIPEWGIGHFLSGGVTFCAMVPMRSIPFQAVCLIGMNDGRFPRPHTTLSFDLMARRFRRGDRSRRGDDRYLFLEALLSARRAVYISYVGNDIRDNTVIPPSVLVSELLDTLERSFYDPAARPLRERLLTRHPLQAFSPRYFAQESGLFSYSEELAKASRTANQSRREPEPFFTAALPEPDAEWRALDIGQLSRFFANPSRYLLRYRLGIDLSEQEGLLETREPFVLDHATGQKLREGILGLHRTGLSLAATRYVLRGEGSLPHAQVGDCVFEREHELVKRFVGRLSRVSPDKVLEPLDVGFDLGGLRLTGALTGVSAEGLLGYRLAKVSARDYLDLWLRHLYLNTLAPPGVKRVSRWIGLDRDVVLKPVADANGHLRFLLRLYWQGLRRPLPFFPRSALAYAEAFFTNAKETPLTAARKLWDGNERQWGESEDVYFQMAFQGRDPLNKKFQRLALAVFGPLLEHREI